MIKFQDIPKHMEDWSFYRTSEVQAEYDKELSKYKDKKKLKNHIYKHLLQYKTWNIIKNAFPYDVEASHYVLWYIGSYVKESDVVISIREFVDGRKAYWGVSKKQSISECKHYHIFIYD